MAPQCKISQREAEKRETRSLSPGQQMKKSRKGNRQDENCPAICPQIRTTPPNRVTTEAINKNVHRQPGRERPTIWQACERRKKQRHLRPVERHVQTIGRLRHQLARQFGLRPQVIKKISAAPQSEGPQGVEMQEIRSLDQAVAVEQSRGGHV